MPRTRPRKHPVTPGVPKPAREFYAGMLLESGMAKESARRLRSDAEEGAQPARRLCRRGKSRREGRRSGQGAGQYYEKVVAVASDADKTRADVNDARVFLAKKS